MEQIQKFIQDMQKNEIRIQKSFERLGSALQEFARRVYIAVDIANQISCDETLRKWYKQLEVARGSKRKRLRRKIKKRKNSRKE